MYHFYPLANKEKSDSTFKLAPMILSNRKEKGEIVLGLLSQKKFNNKIRPETLSLFCQMLGKKGTWNNWMV